MIANESWRKSSFSNGADGCVEVTWRKSSYSNGADACVEVGWRKSSFSAAHGACVEVAPTLPGVAVRDSKNPDGGNLAFHHGPWQAFLTCAPSRTAR
jgi:hypothetical protein